MKYVKMFLKLWLAVTCILYLTHHSTEAASLRCYGESLEDYVEVPLEQASDIANTPYIKRNNKLIIVIHGYANKINKPIENIIDNFIEAFGDAKNYCALNWEVEAAAYLGSITEPIKKFLGLNVLGIDYFPVSIIAGHVGAALGKVLVQMQSHGVNMKLVTLIGHSEGAHLAGAAGRVVKDHGTLIGRITGLDPAKPAIERHLDKDCAQLVVGVHTNPNMFGTNKAVGHVDFWPNNNCRVQPGCKSHSIPLTEEYICSHTRALELMADVVKYPGSLIGCRAANFGDFANSCNEPDPTEINFVGNMLIPNNTGSFYLCTASESKYGLGLDGMQASSCTCPTK